jgi:hypothetical protein
MALNSVKFRIEGDGTSALKALNDVKRGMADVKNVMASEISQKIKQAFSVGAIEEMTRRTAQWANELTNTARKLQVTTDELQGFQIAARKLGMDEGKVEGYFNTLEDSAYEALKGNTALLISFGKLGIKMDELRNKKPAQLFESVLKGISTPAGIQGAQEIFGRGEPQDLRSIAGVMGGKTGAQMAAENPNQVVPAEDLAQIKASWGALLQSLVKVRSYFATFVSFLLDLVTGLIEMVRGTVSMVTRGWKLIAYGIGSMFGSKASKKKLEELSKESEGAATAIGAGIRNSLKGMVNMGARVVGADDVFDYEQKPEGMSQKLWEDAQGTGAAITAIGTGGTRGFTGKGPSGLTGVATGTFNKLSTAGGKAFVSRMMRGSVRIGSMEDVASMWKELGLGEFTAPKNALEAQSILDKIQEQIVTSKGRGPQLNAKIAQIMASVGSALSTYGSFAGVGMVGARKSLAEQALGEAPFSGRNPMMNFGGFGGGGGGNANLRIGGVFGTDVSFKIIQLNQEMVTILTRMLSIMEGNRNPSQYVTPTGLH